MAELKTKVNDASVSQFLESIPNEATRRDCHTLFDMMHTATNIEPKMWGDAVVGFGVYHYKSRSGREGDWYIAGFSPRKQNLTLYMHGGWAGHTDLLAKLDKHSLGMGCMYIKRLDDVDKSVLKTLIDKAFNEAIKTVKDGVVTYG